MSQYQPVPYGYAPLTDQRQTSTAVLVVAWVLAVLGGLYLLPWAIAATRGKATQWGVFWLNLLLGWTGVGWIVALVMACTAHRPVVYQPVLQVMPVVQVMPVLPPAPAPSGPPAGWYTDPVGDGNRYWDGTAWSQHTR
ncbi:MAG TPA: superinfection immunity protein [Propionicimonas sp.]|jgi:hypothetical protein|nr:superinfection immunity protein [Propionicimonas sp.]